jgi:hypothetical protein
MRIEEPEELPFDRELNEYLLLDYLDTPKDKLLKFSNPIRDYTHLLSNRLIHHIVDLQELIDDKKYKEIPEEDKNETAVSSPEVNDDDEEVTDQESPPAIPATRATPGM